MGDSPETELKLFVATTAQFLARTSPLGESRKRAELDEGFDRNWWRRGAELGWAGLLVAPEYGGGSVSGLGLVDATRVGRELGRVVAPGPFTVTNVVAGALSSAPTAAQHRSELERIVAGEVVPTWAVYEPGRGWRPDDTATAAQSVAGGFRIHGLKDRVESGGQADVFLVSARHGGGLSQFLVPRETSGVTVRESGGLDLTRRYAEVEFHDVLVPPEALVGVASEAADDLDRQLDTAAVLQCSETLGVIDEVFAMTVRWAFDRYSFGRPLASYQVIKHRFADMKATLEACHATTVAAAEALARGSAQAGELAAVASSFVGPHATDLVQDCVQLHGGIGVTTEHDLHIYLRRATVNRAMWGTPSEHRRRIADLVCGPIEGAKAVPS